MGALACAGLLFVAAFAALAAWTMYSLSDAKMSKFDDTADQRVRAEILEIEDACEKYREYYGCYPALMEKLTGSGIYSGTEVDPWGNPYKIRVVLDRVLIISYGADGKAAGTGRYRDRNSWDDEYMKR